MSPLDKGFAKKKSSFGSSEIRVFFVHNNNIFFSVLPIILIILSFLFPRNVYPPPPGMKKKKNPGNPAVFRFQAPRRIPTTRCRDEVGGVTWKRVAANRNAQNSKRKIPRRGCSVLKRHSPGAYIQHPSGRRNGKA